MKIEDPTKRLEGVKVPFNDCRELVNMYIYVGTYLERVGKVTVDDISTGVTTLATLLEFAKQCPDEAKRVATQIKECFDDADPKARVERMKADAIKAKVNELMKLLME